MKWDDDYYKYMKWDIYDVVVRGIGKEEAKKITIQMLCDAIDEMVDKLVKE